MPQGPIRFHGLLQDSFFSYVRRTSETVFVMQHYQTALFKMVSKVQTTETFQSQCAEVGLQMTGNKPRRILASPTKSFRWLRKRLAYPLHRAGFALPCYWSPETPSSWQAEQSDLPPMVSNIWCSKPAVFLWSLFYLSLHVNSQNTRVCCTMPRIRITGLYSSTRQSMRSQLRPVPRICKSVYDP
jgi:hypothetical protein